MPSSADMGLGLGVDQHLQSSLQQLTHPLALISAAQQIQQRQQGRLVLGHRV
jgi:hypothetical protein